MGLLLVLKSSYRVIYIYMNVCMSVNHGRLNVKRDILKMKRTKERMICIYFHVCGKVKNIKATPIVFFFEQKLLQ